MWKILIAQIKEEVYYLKFRENRKDVTTQEEEQMT